MIRNSIEIVKSEKKRPSSFFYINGYSFIRKNNSKLDILETNIKVDLNSHEKYSYGDLNAILKDIDQEPMYSIVITTDDNLKKQKDIYLKWITEIPEEEVKYIEKYESEISENDCILFHDFKKKYIDICTVEDENLNCGIAFIGYTLIKNSFEIKIKAFNYKVLKRVTEKINNQFIKNKFQIQMKNLNWIRIKSFEVMENKRFSCSEGKKLLKYTLDKSCTEIFKYVFEKVDKTGFVELSEAPRDSELEKKTKEEIRRKIEKKKQILPLMKPYSKLNINNKFMYIHDQEFLDLRDEMDNRVYSFSPRLMQYYEKQWFEDYIGEILKIIDGGNNEFRINDRTSGVIYNFYEDSNQSNSIEIDWLINIEKNGVHKIIGIECKKTLAQNCYNKTKEKVVNKIIKSGKDIIDGYIIVGFLKENKYNKDLRIENLEYFKPENLFQENEYNEEDAFIQYLSVCDTDIDVLGEKLIRCIDIIFENTNKSNNYLDKL